MLVPNAVFFVVVTLLGEQGKHARPAAQVAKTVEARLSLGAPVQVGAVAIVPIESTLPLSREEYMTLTEAMKAGTVMVIEIQGGGEVNDVEVQNKGDRPILLVGGELILGGQQDRIVAKDCIIPPREKRRVPVFCVEHGRWDGKPVFMSGNTIVPAKVRGAALESKQQQRVWDSVAGTNAVAHAAPSTGTIRGTLNDPTIQRAAKSLVTTLNSQFKPTTKTVGMIFWLNGKIVSADVFGNPRLFVSNREKLLNSYAVDAQLEKKPKLVPVDPKVCQTFLANIVAARRTSVEQTTFGTNVALADCDVSGFESGRQGFRGGLTNGHAKGGAGSPGGAGFSHGTYRPKGGG